LVARQTDGSIAVTETVYRRQESFLDLGALHRQTSLVR